MRTPTGRTEGSDALVMVDGVSLKGSEPIQNVIIRLVADLVAKGVDVDVDYVIRGEGR